MNLPEISAYSRLTGLVDASLAEAGLAIRGFVPTAALRATLDALPEPLRLKYATDRARGAAAVALAYGEGTGEAPEWAREWLAARPGPLASIARFARANWYGELVRRLKAAAALARGRILAEGGRGAPRPGDSSPTGDLLRPEFWRCAVNSGLPEKRLALAAGIGVLGRQGLILVDGAGPACLLGLLLLPFETEGQGRAPCAAELRPAFGEACGDCRACVEACPTGALSGEGFERLKCLQHWTTVPGALPPDIEAVWGARLYGCELCLEACPRFCADPRARTELGPLGPALPAQWLIEAGEAEIKARFRGTALGMSWMPVEAFRRNARLALRHSI